MPKGHLPLDLTIAAFETALQLTINRYNQGMAFQIEVLQARTQLESTRAQAITLGIQRAQFEHAIAILLGKPPADGVADTMIKAFDRLAKRLSTRRGGRLVPHPSPVEAT